MNWGLHLKRQNDYAYFDQCFSNEEIQKIVDESKKSKIENAVVGADLNAFEYNEQKRKTKLQWIEIAKENEWLYQKITNLVITINSNWFNFDLTSVEPVQFLTYEKDSFYTKHIDFFPETYNNPRKLSFVIQLTNSEDYEGGSTLLHLGKKPLEMTKKKGSMFFFPSYVLHEVTPITAGTRFAVVGWVQGPPFK